MGMASWRINPAKIYEGLQHDHENDKLCVSDAFTVDVPSNLNKEQPPASATWWIWCYGAGDYTEITAKVEVVTEPEPEPIDKPEGAPTKPTTTTKPTTATATTTTTAANKGEASSAVVFGGRQFLGSLMITIGTLVFYPG